MSDLCEVIPNNAEIEDNALYAKKDKKILNFFGPKGDSHVLFTLLKSILVTIIPFINISTVVGFFIYCTFNCTTPPDIIENASIIRLLFVMTFLFAICKIIFDWVKYLYYNYKNTGVYDDDVDNNKEEAIEQDKISYSLFSSQIVTYLLASSLGIYYPIFILQYSIPTTVLMFVEIESKKDDPENYPLHYEIAFFFIQSLIFLIFLSNAGLFKCMIFTVMFFLLTLLKRLSLSQVDPTDNKKKSAIIIGSYAFSLAFTSILTGNCFTLNDFKSGFYHFFQLFCMLGIGKKVVNTFKGVIQS